MKLIIIFFISALLSDDFINLQVLEMNSKTELKKYMKSIAKDLGTKCKFCHDMDDKSIDTPHKEVAREMIILTRQINDYLNTINNHDNVEKADVVTGWTCHKGNTEVEKSRPESE